MNCSDREEDLVLYADGELSGREKAEVEAHLESCRECSSRVERLRTVRLRVTESLKESVVAPDIADSVMARISAERPRVRRSRLWWAWAAAPVAAAACALFVWTNRHSRVEIPPKQPIVKIREEKPSVHQDRSVRESKTPPVIIPHETNGRRQIAAKRAPKIASSRRSARRTAPSRAPAQDLQAQKPAAPENVVVRVEWAPGEASSGRQQTTIVVSTPAGKFVIAAGGTAKPIPVPPDRDAAQIDRPPLRTIVRPKTAPTPET